MSRIGRKPIEIPKGVTIKISDRMVEVQGPQGKLTTPVPTGIEVRQQNGSLLVRPARAREGMEERELLALLTHQEKALWGLARALLANAVRGVSQGYSKELEIVGVGYRAEVKGKVVQFNLGFSRPIDFPIPEGLQVSVDKGTRVKVSGIDRRLVGQAAANIRDLRPPDPYKQKGIRYAGEVLRKKAGKAAATGAK